MKKIILTLILLAVLLTSCAATKQTDDNGKITTETAQAPSVSEETTSSVNDSSKAESEKPDESEFAITQEEAINMVRELYGSLYKVNEPEYKNGILYFSVEDKTEKPFAEISVNLKTADAKEKLLNTGETIEFNLLS